MEDKELKQGITEICETLKATLNLLSDLNRSQVALANTLFQQRPELKPIYDKQWDILAKVSARSLGPDISEQLLKIDELIQKMKTNLSQ